MSVLPLYGNPPKRDIIQVAFEECGQAGYEFELTPEEYSSALRRLNAIMGELLGSGIDLGFYFPQNSFGSPEEGSGIPLDSVQAVGLLLAESIAPSIGKTLSAESNRRIVSARSQLYAKYMAIPQMEMGRQTPRGMGNRYWQGPRPYFVTDTSDDEVQQ